MLATIFNRGSIPVLEALMRYSTVRHKAISNNVANVDTPGYKALDVSERDFEKALARAFENRRQSPGGVFEMPSVGRLRQTAHGLDIPIVEAAQTGILRHIENNVDLDLEMGRMVKNSSLHAVASTILTHEFNLLRSSIQERAVT